MFSPCSEFLRLQYSLLVDEKMGFDIKAHSQIILHLKLKDDGSNLSQKSIYTEYIVGIFIKLKV